MLENNDMTYLSNMETMLVPREYEKGNYLVIDVVGDSMNDGTLRSIRDGDRLLAKELDKTFWTSRLHFRQYLFTIISSEGIVTKQIIDHNVQDGIITCHSFNSAYNDYTVDLRDVYQLFYVKKIVERR